VLGVVHRPFVYDVGPVEITGFGIAMLGAFIIAQIVMSCELERREQTIESAAMADIMIAAVVGGLIGAKLYYVALTHDSIFHRGGFVFWGGLMGGLVSTAAVIRYKKLPYMRLADVAGIGLAAAYAVGRTGCWAVGDDYGRPWASRFAVSFPNGAPPSTAANLYATFGIKSLGSTPGNQLFSVYPTQLYEVAAGFVMFLILWRLRDHHKQPGWLFGVYFILAGIERFAVEFLRAKDDRLLGGLTIAQGIALAFIVAGIAIVSSTRSSLSRAT
jgi:phosphatidylglycerol:prolipoprotein diacylglycerol transferase